MTKKKVGLVAALLLLACSYHETWQHRPVEAIVFLALAALALKVNKL